MYSLNNSPTFYSSQISNMISNTNIYSFYEQDNNNNNNQENNDICSSIGENFINNNKNNNNQNLYFYEKTDSYKIIERYSEEEITKGIKKSFNSYNIYDYEEENIEKKDDKTTEIKHKDDEQNINYIDTSKIGSFKQQINKKNKKPYKKIYSKNLNKKRKRPIFRTINISFKFGNKLLKNNFRVSNLKCKILRNFIQEIIPFWITGKIPKKNEKLNVDNIINDYKNHKSKKISEFFNQKIKIEIANVIEIIKIKLEFTLKEAFLCFAKGTFNKGILSNVLGRLNKKNNEIDEKLFFEGLDKKAMYINNLVEKEKDYKNMRKAFSQLIEDFEKLEIDYKYNINK